MPTDNNKHLVIALAADLIFAARIRSTAEANDVVVILAKNVEDFLTKVRELEPRLAILDLDRRGLDVASTVKQASASTELLCYVSHVREDLIAIAREAGAQRVIARGAFTRQIAELLQ